MNCKILCAVLCCFLLVLTAAAQTQAPASKPAARKAPAKSSPAAKTPAPAAVEPDPIAAKIEMLGARLKNELSSSVLGELAKAKDPTSTNIVVVSARLPRGQKYANSDFAVTSAGAGHKVKAISQGYAPKGSSRWMFATGNRSFDFIPGGEGTIDMDFAFPVPKETTQLQFLYKGHPIGEPFSLQQ